MNRTSKVFVSRLIYFRGKYLPASLLLAAKGFHGFLHVPLNVLNVSDTGKIFRSKESVDRDQRVANGHGVLGG